MGVTIVKYQYVPAATAGPSNAVAPDGSCPVNVKTVVHTMSKDHAKPSRHAHCANDSYGTGTHTPWISILELALGRLLRKHIG